MDNRMDIKTGRGRPNTHFTPPIESGGRSQLHFDPAAAAAGARYQLHFAQQKRGGLSSIFYKQQLQIFCQCQKIIKKKKK